MAFGDLWSNRKYPDGCRNCGQTATKHVGLGLCQSCYRQDDIQNAARNGTLDELSFDEPVFSNDDSFVYSENEEEVVVVDPDDIFASGERQPGSVASPVTEPGDVPPGVKRGIGDFFKKKANQEKKPPFKKTSEKPPRGVGRRVSAAGTIEDVWAAIGGVAVRTGQHAPLGRYLMWQAPAAGEMLDDALAGSFVDRRLLQPAVKTRGRLDVVAAIVGPPAIIFAIEQNPARAEQLIPILKSTIRSSLPSLLPAMKKAQAREEKMNKAVTELFGDDFPPGVDPVDVVIEQMFSGWIVPPAPTTYEEETDYATAQPGN